MNEIIRVNVGHSKVSIFYKELGHMKRDCSKLGGREVMSQASVSQRPRTQTSVTPQPPVVVARVGVQS